MTVEELLVSRQVYFVPKGADAIVTCLNPEHADSSPSMRIDKITGIFNCFSCGYKGNIFTHFGEKANQLQLRRELLKKRIREKRSESVGLSFPKGSIPYVGNWRNIKPETYKGLKHSNTMTLTISVALCSLYETYQVALCPLMVVILQVVHLST